MLEKTYRARRYDEAIAMIKRDLGPEAVIVSTRKIGSEHGAGAGIEVVAAPGSALPMEPVRGGGLARARTTRADAIVRDLVDTGVPSSAARVLVERMGARTGVLAAATRELTEALSQEMVFGGPLAAGGARVVALVGPTGVGKTTTIAKLAARAALIERRRVGLVSIDDYRVGGSEQLAQYADLIGIPIEVARDGRGLARALAKLEGADLVLVDTAGRAPRDRAAITEMAERLQAAGEPVEVHMCLAASTRDTEMRSVIERLAVLRPTKLDVTKLDEAMELGSIVAAQVWSGLPLAYFTTGQRVPEDIEVASAARLAALLCNGPSEVN